MEYVHVLRLFLPLLFLLSLLGTAVAGGLFGDIIDKIAPGAGTTLDKAHEQVKNTIHPYKLIEEGATKTVNETFVQTGAPALQELIAQSRNDALNSGVDPIPDEIRANLEGFISKNILDIARYRVRGGGDLTLQVNAIRYGEASAITLDYVIVFKEEGDALNNPTLWAHELTHVDQYQRWGIKDFSIRYLRSHTSVEREAYEAETRYLAWVGINRVQVLRQNGQPVNAEALNRPIVEFGTQSTSDICGTIVGAYRIQSSGRVGTPCWTNTPFGDASGALVPADSVTVNFPRMSTPGPPANACTTQFGIFPMAPGVNKPAGVSCQVMIPQGVLPGITELRRVNNFCTTRAGSCPLFPPRFSGSGCACPTPWGMALGVVP